MYKYLFVCKDCPLKREGTTDYIGFNLWSCAQCGSRNIILTIEFIGGNQNEAQNGNCTLER